MSFVPFSIDLETIISPEPITRSQFQESQIEKLANLFLQARDTIKPIIVRKISPISFEVLEGYLEYYAALKAEQIDEQFTSIQAYVVPTELESTVLEQYNFLRSLSSSPVEVTPTPISSTSLQLPDLAQMERNISDRLEQKLMANLRSMIENTIKQIINESLEGFSSQITNHLDKQLTDFKQSWVVVAGDQTPPPDVIVLPTEIMPDKIAKTTKSTKSKSPTKTQVPSKSKLTADILKNKENYDNDPKRLEVINDFNTLNVADLERKLKLAKVSIKAKVIHEQRSHQLFTSIEDIKNRVDRLAEKTMQKIIAAW
jgi:hypothetical protein